MLTHRFSNSRIYQLTLGVLILALLFIYQTGGYVDGFDIQARNESLRDYGVWVRAGENLLLDKNPYLEDVILKSGTFSSLMIYLLFKLSFDNYLFFLIMQALNILGVVTYLYIFRFTSPASTVMLFLMLTFSSTREVLVNGQTTGILIGGFAVAYKLLDAIHNQEIKTKYLRYFALLLASLFLIFGLDLKPNLMLIPFLVLIKHYKEFRVFFLSLVLWTIHQLYFSFKVNDLLFFSWINNLREVVSYNTNPNFFGSIGVWQVFNFANLPALFLEVAPVITFLTMGLISLFSLRRWGINVAIFLAFFANYLYTYFHFYSFAPLLAYLIFKLLNHRHYGISGFAISSMQFSFNYESSTILFLSLGVLAMLLTLYTLPSYKATFYFCLGWVAFIPVKLSLFAILDLEPLVAKSIVALIPIVFSTFVSWELYGKKKSGKISH
jgi:hypothetical protein